MEFVLVNGKIIAKEDAELTNFIWGEPFLLTQQVWFGYGGIPLFNENIEVIKQQMNTLGGQLPPLFENRRELFRLSKRMLNKNKYYRSGYLSYQFIISNQETNFWVISKAFSDFIFPFFTKGILASFSEIKKNSALSLNQYSFYNKALWQAAKTQIIMPLEEGTILRNEKGFVCEGIAANIFMVKENVLITPALRVGCYQDTLRNIILQLAKKIGLKVIETSCFEKTHIFDMNEVFFASEQEGVKWVLGIDNKRFVSQYSKKISEELNTFLKERVC